MPPKKIRSLMIGPLLAASCAAQAALVANEANSEFSDFSFQPTTFSSALGVGANTIKGAVGSSPKSDDYADFFRVTLPAGLQIVSASVQIQNGSFGCNTAGTSCIAGLFSDSAGDSTGWFSANGTFGLPNAVLSATAGAMNLDFGTRYTNPDGVFGGFGYLVTLNVAAIDAGNVPEPAGLALLGLGLAALVATRRRVATA